MSAWRLLADIGGTNARFARSRPNGEIFARRIYNVTDFADFDSALQAYLADTGNLEACSSAAVDAAGPVFDGQVQLTNARWRISESGISQLLGNVPTRLFNDLEVVALSLPHLEDTDLQPIGDLRELPSHRQRMLALNVGTGFGAAVAFRWNGTWLSCPSEAGHISFAAQDEAELALLATGDCSSFTVEDALSGHGLVRLYQKQCALLGTEVSASSAKEVFARVSLDTAAKHTLRIFTIWLGRVARDLTLATAAWDGVFLTGGVIQSWCNLASSHLFRTSFEAEGKMQAQLSRIYTAVIARDDIPLFSLARASIG